MKKCFLIFLCLIGCLFFGIPAQADIGPKSGISLFFEHAPEGEFYATLLSESTGSGPYGAAGVQKDLYEPEDDEYPVWKKFADYQDSDGFYFLQYFEECSASGTFIWDYWPPEVFKILLYFPETDTFAVSEQIYEAYAFYSNFTVNMQGYDTAEDGMIKGSAIQKSNDYSGKAGSALLRVILTIFAELAVAWLFGYREKKSISLIACVNVVTQLLVNILAVLVEIAKGPWSLILCYVFMELLVVIIESVIYRKHLRYTGQQKNEDSKKAVIYAVTANACSMIVGLFLI